MPEKPKARLLAGDLVPPGRPVRAGLPHRRIRAEGPADPAPAAGHPRPAGRRGAGAGVPGEGAGAALAKPGISPALVITDSQAFREVSGIVPEDIPLTSFSILMARYKGFLDTAVAGSAAVDRLRGRGPVLMAEGCTHHRQCNDIGTVKLPRWLRAHTGRDTVIETCSGREFPEDLTPYRLVIHCGGCMLTERVVQYRMNLALPGRALHQLRHRHRPDDRRAGAQPAAVPGAARDAGGGRDMTERIRELIVRLEREQHAAEAEYAELIDGPGRRGAALLAEPPGRTRGKRSTATRCSPGG